MDLSKFTMGESTFGVTMPILLLLFFTAVAGGIAIALGSTRRTALMIAIGTVILIISGYCLFLACNSVLHAKKTVKAVKEISGRSTAFGNSAYIYSSIKQSAR